MKFEKIKVSDSTYGEIQKIKQNSNMPHDEDCISMLIQYHNDPLFHLSEDFKLELMKLMDKQDDKVTNIEEMIHVLIQYYNDPVFHLSEDFKLKLSTLMDKQKDRYDTIEEVFDSMIEQLKEIKQKSSQHM